MILTFNEFIKKHNLRNKATSNIKIQQVLSSLSLNDVGIYLRDGPFESDVGIVNLHPSKRTHWFVIYMKNILIHMVVLHLKNYLNFLKKKWVLFIFRISDSKK